MTDLDIQTPPVRPALPVPSCLQQEEEDTAFLVSPVLYFWILFCWPVVCKCNSATLTQTINMETHQEERMLPEY